MKDLLYDNMSLYKEGKLDFTQSFAGKENSNNAQ